MFNNLLLTQNNAGNLSLWNLKTKEEEQKFFYKRPNYWFHKIYFHNEYIIVVDRNITIFDSNTGKSFYLDECTLDMIVHKGRIIYSCKNDLKTYTFWNQTVDTLYSNVKYFKILPNDQLLTQDGINLRIWDLETRDCVLHKWVDITFMDILKDGTVFGIAGNKVSIYE